MPLIICTDCGRQVSTSASACPNCGWPVPAQKEQRAAPPVVTTPPEVTRPPVVTPPVARPDTDANTVLLTVRESWWNFSWHVFAFVIAMPLLLWIIPNDWWSWFWAAPVGWAVFSFMHTWYHRKSFVMRIYPDRVSVVEGFIAKETSEFFIKDIRSIDIRQGLWGRIVNIGDVTISTAATTEGSELAEGVPRPRAIKELLISRRQQHSTD